MPEEYHKPKGQAPKKLVIGELLYLIAGIFSPQLLFGLVVNNQDGTWSLSSPYCEVTVNVACEGIPTGAILNLSYQGNDLIGDDEEMFAIRAGGFYPASGYVNTLGTNRIELISHEFTNQKGETIDLNAEIDITLIDNRLLIKHSIETLNTTEFPEGLDVVSTMSIWGSITCYNHTGVGFSVSTLVDSKDLRWSVFPILELKNSYCKLWMISRNPYWGLWNLSHALNSKEWTIRAEILERVPSYSGPAAFSTLKPRYELNWEYEIVIGRADDTILSALGHPLVYFSPFPDDHEQIIMMMFDNIPFEVPYPIGAPETWNVAESGHDTTAPVGQYMVRLLEDHPQMKQTWLILCDYIRDSTWIANPEETDWWRVRGKYRGMLLSTEKFRAWLRDTESDNLTYGYETQAHLGLHGHHHTPSDSQPDYYTEDGLGPGWEFQHYEPEKTESTFVVIDEIFDSLGLTDKSFRNFRPPGFKRTSPLLYCLLDRGCKAADIGFFRRDNWIPWLWPIYSSENRMWLLSSTWSGDTPDNYDYMKNVLQRGEYVLTAGHPSSWWDNAPDHDSAYEMVNRVFTNAERDFPYLGYLFPDEYGDFLDELYEIHNINTSYSKLFGLTLTFTGRLSKGEALVVEFDPNNYCLDGDIWMNGEQVRSFEIRGSRIFITLPQSELDLHTVIIPIIPSFIKNRGFPKDRVECIPNPATDKIDILFTGELGQTANIIVYNILGQIVRRIDIEFKYSDRVCYSWNTADDSGYLLPTGIYYIEVRGNSYRYKDKVVILR